MRQILLDESAEKFERKLRCEIICCCLGCIAAIGLNVLFCFLRTDENHNFLLAANILIDVICGWVVIYRGESSVKIKRMMLKLWKRPHRTLCAVVEAVSQEQHRVPGLDCLEVVAGGRRLYLPLTQTIQLEEGVSYTFGLVDNVIVEAET